MDHEYWRHICRQAIGHECEERYGMAAEAWKRAAGLTDNDRYRQWDLARAKKCERLAHRLRKPVR